MSFLLALYAAAADDDKTEPRRYSYFVSFYSKDGTKKAVPLISRGGLKVAFWEAILWYHNREPWIKLDIDPRKISVHYKEMYTRPWCKVDVSPQPDTYYFVWRGKTSLCVRMVKGSQQAVRLQDALEKCDRTSYWLYAFDEKGVLSLIDSAKP